MLIRNAVVLLTTMSLVACGAAQPVRTTVIHEPTITSEHKVETTYQVGVPMEVFVGERMIRVQDFHVTVSESGVTSTQLNPTQAFRLRLPPFMSAAVSEQDVVQVTGTTERDGQTYRLVQLPVPVTAALRFLITESGAFEGSALNTAGARMGWSYTPNPESVRLVPAKSKTKVDAEKGTTNFELVYSGTTKDAFQLLYREYTQNDMARPAFSQTLVYEKGDSSIRFRNLQLDVLEATNEKIRFVVVSDGRDPP